MLDTLSSRYRAVYRVLMQHEIIVFVVFLLFAGLLSVSLRQEMSFDLRNYHFYNPWALLHGRLNVDLAPAQLQTYLNPLIDVPGYLLIRHLPPILVGFVWGVFQGMNLILVFKIAHYVLGKLPFSREQVFALSILVAVLSFLDAGNMIDLGGFSGDNVDSIFVLLSIWYLLQALDSPVVSNKPDMLLCGLLVGMAVSLKLTAIIYLFSVGIFVIVFSGSIRAKWRNLVFFPTISGLLLS